MPPHKRPYSTGPLNAHPVQRYPLPPVRVPMHETTLREVPRTPSRPPSQMNNLPPIKVYTVKERRCTCSSRTFVMYGAILMATSTAVIVTFIVLHYLRIIDWFPFLNDAMAKFFDY
ncbi:hypothetical protein Y032_0059g3006 [Ancylostoma ceylanicum]|nr:hypothetical protein Y032_0059g3006 [Ancylostoma ceylanicum]